MLSSASLPNLSRRNIRVPSPSAAVPERRIGIHSSYARCARARRARNWPSPALWFSAPFFQASLATSWSSQVAMKG